MKPSASSKRPENLEISTIKLPLAALTSITHRISGVILFVAIGTLLWMLDLSLASEASYEWLSGILDSTPARFVLWGILAALAYHMVAGCKHLLMDMGFGETKAAATRGAMAVIVTSAILIIAIGVYLW